MYATDGIDAKPLKNNRLDTFVNAMEGEGRTHIELIASNRFFKLNVRIRPKPP